MIDKGGDQARNARLPRRMRAALPGVLAVLVATGSASPTPPSGNDGLCSGYGPPEGRDGATAVWTGSELLIWGGFDGMALAGVGYRYAPATDTWRLIPPGRSPRRHHSAVWTGAGMIVWGGLGAIELGSGAAYDPASDAWKPIANGPSPRRQHSAIWAGSEMIVWGGVKDSGFNAVYYQDGGRYDPATDSWRATGTGTNVPSWRANHSAVWTGAEMVIWGGGTQVASLQTGGRYDPTTDAWKPTAVTPATPPKAQGHQALWTGALMLVWTGSTTGASYEPVSDAWVRFSTAAAPDTWGDSIVWTGTEMIVWGGLDSSTGFQSTGARYEPVADVWTPTGSTGAPTERTDHVAVWTGSEMIVWGGTDGTILASGGRYRPSTNSWLRTDAGVFSPSPRSHPLAVWTGSRLVIWGSGTTRTGGVYDPATDSWAPTSTGASCPSGRYGASAVWTGSEMVVWGGWHSSPSGWAELDDGGRYDPATDTWRPTSTAPPAAAPRGWHTAVWTGSRMVVWGGTDLTSNGMNTGGQYDPIADAWAPTSTTSAPSPRTGHTAVWSGTEMIVWGGSGYTTDGGRYDPVSDTWTPTSTSGAPTYRSCHSAVWTGSEMIVWGGSTGYPTNTGGRYDPVADAWSPTSTAGAPGPRTEHTAVWAGGRMLIWGGSDLYYSFAGGGYDPVTDTWTLISTAGAPLRRRGHAAVSTGSEMVLWGGDRSQSSTCNLFGGSPRMGSGGRYDPGSDTWASCCTAIDLLPLAMPAATQGTFYEQYVSGTGGASPYTYNRSGTIPPGMTFDQYDPAIRGTPTTPGTYSFSVTATDASGCRTSRPYTLIVQPYTCPAITVAPSSLPDGEAGQPYAATLTASGGRPPYSWSSTGTLPLGLAFDGATAVLSGTPRTQGTFAWMATAVDADGCAGQRSYALTIDAPRNDILAGQGLGPPNPNRVRVFERDGTATAVDFFAYAAGTWGVNVAGADADGGGLAEILTGPGPGPVHGPQVRGFLFDAAPIAKLNFFAYSTQRYGVNVAGAPVDGDGHEEILTGAGPGAVFGPHVRGFDFDGAAISVTPGLSYFAYGTLRFGVNVTGGNLDGDASAEILTGTGPGPTFAPQVRGWDYVAPRVNQMGSINFNAYAVAQYGVNVAAGDATGDSKADAATGPGPGTALPARILGFDAGAAGVFALPGFDITPYATAFGARPGLGPVVRSVTQREELLTGAGPDPSAPSLVQVYEYKGSTLVAAPVTITPFAPGYGVNVTGAPTGY